jgi:hypothetical protein
VCKGALFIYEALLFPLFPVHRSPPVRSACRIDDRVNMRCDEQFVIPAKAVHPANEYPGKDLCAVKPVGKTPWRHR